METRPLLEVLMQAQAAEEQAKILRKQASSLLRATRSELDWSQEDLATALHKSQSYVAMVENGYRTMSPQTATQLYQAIEERSSANASNKEDTEEESKEGD